MNYIGKLITNFRDFYNEINPATLTGAIDVVVVRQPDGTYLSSPFHVRFGKIGVLRSREKIVDIEVNNEPIDIHMKLGESGEAFFVEETEEEEVPQHLATSPIPPSPNLEEELRKLKQSAEIENGINGEVVVNEQYDSTKFPFDHTTNSNEVNTQEIISNHVNGSESIAEENAISDTVSESKPVNNISHDSISENKPLNNISHDSVSECDKVLSDKVHRKHGTSNGPLISSALPNFMPILEETSIGIQTGSFVNEKTEDISAIEHSVSGVLTEECEDAKTKRRRKRRIRTKVRQSFKDIKVPIPIREGIDIPVSQSSFVSMEQRIPDGPEDIFQMDEELDEGFSANSMIRSMSLPLNNPEYRQQLSEKWSTRRLSATYTGELHPFSDGDVTPLCSPPGSRPPSPKSDTEFETQKHDATCQTYCEEVSWDWGELPNLPKKGADGKGKKVPERKAELASSDDEDTANKSKKAEEEKRSMLGGMWNFMRSTKKLRHMPESEGIYLDDFNDLDPEVAALYFPKFKYFNNRSDYQVESVKEQICDEDAESGNGPSLPQSPHSVEGAIGGPQCVDSDTEDRHSFCYYCSKHYNDLAMSLCGGLQDGEGEVPAQCFLQSIVTYDDLSENPSLIQNPNLVIRMNGKYYNWQTAAPMILSMVMFQRLLPEKTFMQLVDTHMPKKKKQKGFSGWWYWRRTNQTTETDSKKDHQALPENNVAEQTEKSEPLPIEKQTATSQELSTETKVTSQEVPMLTTETASGHINIHISSEASSVTSSPSKGHLDLVKSQEDVYASTSSETEAEPVNTTDEDKKVIRTKRLYSHHEKYKKSLRLSSEGIASLNLKEGENEVVFSVTTAYQGTSRCKCNIYLWNYDDKIIISDIDGTITKSDVLGHLLPIIGKDWAQLGVANLFSKAQKNGYQFLYLSARAIGQSRGTREYLRSIRQGDISLPDGPLLLSPTSLLSALHREVIEKRPEEFKISCLKDIKALFPSTSNPFYAGFGNKINDTWAYRAVDIPMGRIFTINHRGELKLELIQTFQSSYTRLSDVVDHIFPPLHRHCTGNLAPNFPAADEYSYFTYWRYPLPKVDENDELVVACKDK